jgi:hypothetical protein
MSYRSKIILSITAILLLPILLGMTPLNFVQKIGAGCPFSQTRQTLKYDFCLYNSVISQDDLGIANLPSTLFDSASVHLRGLEVLNSHPITSNIPLSAIPLRC